LIRRLIAPFTLASTTSVLAMAWITGCGREPAPAERPTGELETVEVTAGPDAALSTAGDAQEKRRSAGLAGALPDGFPADIPVFRPASLVDFSERPGGGVRLRFDTSASSGEVRSFCESRLRAAGWRSAAGGLWTLGERRVTLSFDSRPAGSSFSIEY
jgi:hypothetical protein